MKLRIKGDSVRLRVPPSGVNKLIAEKRLREEVRFSLHPYRAMAYSILLDQYANQPTVEFDESGITVRLPEGDAQRWATTDTVSIEHKIKLDEISYLQLLIEKDFACLDLSDGDNADTYPNPLIGQGC